MSEQPIKSWLLTIEEAAKLLSVSPWTIRRAIWAGEVQHVRLGRAVRVRREDLETWVAANTLRNESVQPKKSQSRSQIVSASAD